MKLTTILACVTAVVALPSPQLPPPSLCLTDKRAQYIVEREKVYLQKANITDARLVGEELFAADFVQYGDSINSLRGDPLGTLVEPDGATYVNNTLSAPPIPTINSLAVLHNCTHIFWQWQFIGVGGPTAPNRVNGFVLITVDNSRETKPVVEQYVEFNSLAWAENIGFTIEFPTEGPFAPERR